ncbi:MAG: IS5 family transposase [Bacillota bacterium]|nr:IS5 family transposase [Bacillota bacterium]
MKQRHELTDKEWARIQRYLPPERTGRRGRPSKCHRLIINAIIWILKTGAPWRDLPEHYGPWSTVYGRFNKWTKNGVLEAILAELSKDLDEEEYMIDGSYIRVHQHASGGKGGPKNRELVDLVGEIPQKSTQLLML